MTELVVFTAWVDKGGYHGPFSTDTTLVYNMEITNIGGAYDPTSGVFTAPVAGVYYFTFFYHAGGLYKSGLSLMKNNEVIIQTSDNTTGLEKVDHGGNATFLSLQAGDKVFVHLHANSRVWAADQTTTFSGFLVR